MKYGSAALCCKPESDLSGPYPENGQDAITFINYGIKYLVLSHDMLSFQVRLFGEYIATHESSLPVKRERLSDPKQEACLIITTRGKRPWKENRCNSKEGILNRKEQCLKTVSSSEN